MDSAGSPVDQTRANLNTTAEILDSIANYVQTQRGSNAARRTVSVYTQILITIS